MSEHVEIKEGQTSRMHEQEAGEGVKSGQTALGFPAVAIQFKSQSKIVDDAATEEIETQSGTIDEKAVATPPAILPPSDPGPTALGASGSIVQPKSELSNAAVSPVQLAASTKPISSFSAPLFQFKSSSIEEAMEEEVGLESKIKADPTGAPSNNFSSSGGLPLAVQAKMEGAMGADFSNVNIHKESQSATEVGALAYAQGNDVHFAPGQYNPDSSAGQELIGHELAHVVQQREGRVQPTTQAKGLPVNDDKGLEAEADAMGVKAAQMKVIADSTIQKKLNDSMSKVLQKAPDAAAPAPAPAAEPEMDTVTGKLSMTQKIKDQDFSYAKGTLSFKGEAEYNLKFPKSKGVGSYEVSYGSKGGSGTLAVKKELEQKAKQKFLGVEWAMKEGIEVNSQGGEIGIEGGFEGEKLFGSLKFVPFSVGEGEDKKTEFKFLTAAIEIGVKMFTVPPCPLPLVDNSTIEGKFKGSFIIELEPNLKKIAMELAKKAGMSLAEGLVVDSAAIGSAAAVVALPALAAGLMIAGAMQTEKNIKASHSAIYAGTAFRKSARQYAQDYASVLTNGATRGSEGGAAAENMLTIWSVANNGTREQAVAAAKKSNGGYGAVYSAILKSAKDKYYPAAVANFNSKFADQFGIVESFGDDWGMKGTFQKDLRMILYADDFN